MKQASAGDAPSLALNFRFTESKANAEGPWPAEIASPSDVCVATDRVLVVPCNRSSLLMMTGTAAQRSQKHTHHMTLKVVKMRVLCVAGALHAYLTG